MLKLKKIIFESPKKVIKTQRLIDNEKGSQLFLKIGNKINSASKFGLGAEWEQETGKHYESGVSCYFLSKSGDKYNISKPDQSRADYGLKNYFVNMFTDVLLIPICLGQINVVKGELETVYSQEMAEWYSEQYPEEIEKETEFLDYLTGTDGEPLLVPGTVSVIETIDPIQFLENFYVNSGYSVLDVFMDNSSNWTYKELPDETPDEFINYLNQKIEEKRAAKK